MSKALFFVFLYIMTFAANTEAREVTILAPVECTDWSSKRNTEGDVSFGGDAIARIRMQFWLLGLVTGMNAMLDDDPNLLDTVNSTLIFDWISRYCAEEPEADLFEGATKFLMEVRKKSRKK